MSLYFKFFAMHIKSQMQYKVSFFLAMLGQITASFLGLVGIYFMFALFNEVAGFTFTQILLCFAIILMTFTLAEIFGRGFDLFPRMLGNGEFDRVLVRPRNVIFQVLASKMEFARIGRIVQSTVVLIYALSASDIVWTWDNILTLVLMIICGSLVFFGLFVIYAAVSFFTIEGIEFMNIFIEGGREFGRYPFVIYGEGVLKFLTYVIPLALFQYWPLLYLLGMEQSRFYMFTPLLSLLFLIPCYAFFRAGLRRYKSTGS